MSILEDEPKKKPAAHELGADLSLLSVDELQERIDLLRQEIVRLEAEVASKEKSRNAAESFFR